MPIRKIEDPHREEVAAVLDDLFGIARGVGASSLLFILETPGRRAPLAGVIGRLRADPHRAIGALSIMKDRLVKLAAQKEFADSSL